MKFGNSVADCRRYIRNHSSTRNLVRMRSDLPLLSYIV